MIDFAKTVVLPPNVHIDHSSIWSVGNHEDGYLIGINNLISIFEEITANREAAANVTLCGSPPAELDSPCVQLLPNCDSALNTVPSSRTNANDEQIGHSTEQRIRSLSLADHNPM